MVAYLLKSDTSEGFNQILDFLNRISIKYALMVNPNIYVSCIKQFWNTVVVRLVNDVTRLQGLVDKKKVVVTEAAIREVLRLDDAEGVDCLSNEEIFIELDRMGYKKPSNQEATEKRDADEHVEEVTTGDDAHRDNSAAHGEVPTITQEPSIPSPTPLTQPPQPPQDLPSTSQHLMLVLPSLRVEHLEYDKVAQVLEITKLKRRVKKLEKRNKGRMIAEMDKDDAVVLMDDKEEDNKVEEAKVDKSAQDHGRQAKSQAKIYKIEMDHANKVLSMQEDETEPAEVQEVVDVVTTAKLITEVVTAASETVTAASAIIPTIEPQVPATTLTAVPTRIVDAPSRRRKEVVIRDPKLESATSTIIPTETKSKDKGKGIMDEAIDHVKRKAKEDPANVAGFKMDYFKGMSYDDIRPIFEAEFNSNVAFLLKTKEHIEEEEENRALQKINETPAERAAKRRKLDEEVEDFKRHLKIVPNEDDDVYTEATPLARKYLEALWSLVKERFSTAKPKNFSDDFLLTTLRAMFETLDAHAQIWKNQRSVHGQAKVKSWKLLESCGVQIITFTTTHLILLVERTYPLSRFTLDQML
nr:xylulose kinase-1 [Tanacetum cinerariifolium]